MPLHRSREEIEAELFVGVRFWMIDGQTEVLCLVRQDALEERAARDGADPSNARRTFEQYRSVIEATASDKYDRSGLVDGKLVITNKDL